MRIGLIALIILIAATGSCVSKPKPKLVARPPVTSAPATRPVVTGKPLLDISRGGAGIALNDSAKLQSRDDLLNSITSAFERRLTLPDSVLPVIVIGQKLDGLDRLKIDISDAVVRDDFRPGLFKNPSRPEPAVAVKHFEYSAWPVYFQKLPSYWRMNATDAKFGLIHDSSGRQMLVLTDAREGTFEFATSLAELRKPRILVTSPTTRKSEVNVNDVDIQITSDDPHSLRMRMQIKITVLFVPMTFQLSGRAEIDPWCNVKLSELSCNGLDPGGKIVAAFVDGAIRKYNGKLMPLAQWPENRVQLTDVQFRVDESLHVFAKFGNRTEPAGP